MLAPTLVRYLLLGVTTGLAALGVPYQAARVAAGMRGRLHVLRHALVRVQSGSLHGVHTRGTGRPSIDRSSRSVKKLTSPRTCAASFSGAS